MARIITLEGLDSLTFQANRTGAVSLTQDLRWGDANSTNNSPFIMPLPATINQIILQDSNGFGYWQGEILCSTDDGDTFVQKGIYAKGTAAVTITSSLASNDTFTVTGHGLSVGDRIQFCDAAGGTLPAPVVKQQDYWVESVPTADTFTISATDGGALLDLTADGSGSYGLLTDFGRTTDIGGLSLTVVQDELIRLRFVGSGCIIYNPQITIHLDASVT